MTQISRRGFGALTLGVSAAALTGGIPAAFAQDFITVLTGGTSGVYYPLGVSLAKIYADSIKGINTNAQATKASVENLNLLQAGRGEVGFALGDSVADAWAGNKEAGFPQKLDKLRAIGAIYPNFIQIVARKDSGIQSLADLKGKRVSVGAPRSGTELNARAVFSAAGLSYDDLGKLEYLPFAESVELVKNRQLDATLQSSGLGVASIRDLASHNEIVIVPVPQDVVTKIGNPVYISATIPANTYDGQTEDVPTAAVVNILVTREGLEDDLVYQMTKAMFEQKAQLVASHNAASAIGKANAVQGLPIPLHPGAERYYKEEGVLK
ncbi:TAXI family TRAP transporter solute-binding subunit [Indioceanicola profundi]|uniref:TAXI family TRAP transporter solute-binding subunit n=1 Tax=Indioceanicola profundi TaxID=2220096 RepID=UPI000E6AB569|nr:TAXI family TRAP transporter solute-binding subunit [Indioceanicola profundi]